MAKTTSKGDLKKQTPKKGDVRIDLIKMLNDALALEHAAQIQYLAHAQVIYGIAAEPVVSRIKEIANDEAEHAEKFREMIGTYLGGIPTMCIAETRCPGTIDEILQMNLDNERTAVEFYETILQKIHDLKPQLKYVYFQLDHMMRHIIIDEEEHIAELSLLLG